MDLCYIKCGGIIPEIESEHWQASMKASTISILVVLVLMMVVPMWFLGPEVLTGRQGSEKDDNIEQLKKKTPKGVKTVVTDREVVVYKWLDKHGIMQFSSVPPSRMDGANEDEGTGGVNGVERVVLSPNTNVIDAIKVTKEEEKKAQKPDVISLGSPYSPEGMKDMISDSLQLQEQMNEKQAEQQKMMDEIINQK